MAKVDFFTAVSFGDQPKSCMQSLLETVDSYFYLGGKKAYVIPGHAQQGSEGTTLRNDSSTYLVTAIKVISYATVILPAIILIAKIVLRSIHTFHLIHDPIQDIHPHPLDAEQPSIRQQHSNPSNTTNRLDAQQKLEEEIDISQDTIIKFQLQDGHPPHPLDAEQPSIRQPHSNPSNTTNRLDAQQKLEEGIDISQDTITKLQQLMPKILCRKDDEEIRWHASGRNLVFSLISIPNLIFKMAPPGRSVLRASGALSAQQLSELRFENMLKAVEVCAANRLNLLVIPHAKKFNVDEMILIAEECVDINQNESAQEHLYQLSGLNETVRQLATFIAKTGFSDVEWRNMPLIDTAPEFQGNRRVALVDLEEMDGAETGIFGGGFGRRGLVRCLHSEAQIDIALTEAQRQGIHSRYSEQVKERRMEEIQSDQQLQQFYMKNGILENPRKPIQVDDLTTLGLNLEEEGSLTILELRRNGSDEEPSIKYRQQPITLRDAVVDVMAQINDAITKTSENASIKGKRYIVLNINKHGSLQDYHRLGLSKDKFVITEEEEKQIWLRRIISALVAKGHLYKLDKVNGHGYFIQA